MGWPALAPAARITVLRVAPVLGAVADAYDRAGPDPAALDGLRHALAA